MRMLPSRGFWTWTCYRNTKLRQRRASSLCSMPEAGPRYNQQRKWHMAPGTTNPKPTATQAEEAATREERDVACAAADAAEALLAEQIPILQKAHDDCDAAADAEYASCQATADGEIDTCTTYLATERRTIDSASSRFRPSTLTSATSKLLEPPF